MPKQSARKKATANTKAEAEYKITRTAKCQTLSKKSTLTYHLSEDDKAIRIYSNSGGGFHSNEWILLDDIKALCSDDHPLTSNALISLFKGKSVNTPSFIIAALLNEGILTQCPGKQWKYIFPAK